MENFSWERCIKSLWLYHRGKSIGVLLGLIISLSILLFGFFKTVFIVLCVCVGLFIGNKIDKNDDLYDTFENLFAYLSRLIPPVFRR